MPERTMTLNMLKEYNEITDNGSVIDIEVIKEMSANTAFIIGSHIDYLLRSAKTEHKVSRHWIIVCKDRLMNNARTSAEATGVDDVKYYELIFDKLADSSLVV